jgi:hypothetical protein
MSDTIDDTSKVARADFLKQLAALIATSQLPGLALPSATAGSRPVPAPPNNLVGIQMGPHTMLDEGIEHALDVCQETASIDTIFTHSRSYGGDVRKPLSWLATDHGASVIDQRTRKLPNVWFITSCLAMTNASRRRQTSSRKAVRLTTFIARRSAASRAPKERREFIQGLGSIFRRRVLRPTCRRMIRRRCTSV